MAVRNGLRHRALQNNVTLIFIRFDHAQHQEGDAGKGGQEEGKGASGEDESS